MIQLGSFDTSVTQAQRTAYLQQATAISGGRGDLAAEGSDKLAFAPYAPEPQQPMTVAIVQQALKSIGFFPGGQVDGICGKGLKFDVNNWSEGCQVINGSAYLGPNNERVDCSSIVATNNGEIASNPSKTRGAYNLLADLVLGLAAISLATS